MCASRSLNPYEKADKVRSQLGGYQCDLTFPGDGHDGSPTDNLDEAPTMPQPTEGSLNETAEELSLSQTSDGGRTVHVSQEEASVLSPQGETSVLTPHEEASVLSSEGETSVLSSEGETSVLLSEGETSVLSSQGETSVLSSQEEASVHSSQGEVSVLSLQGEASVLSSQGETSVLSSHGEASVLLSQEEASVLSSQGETPVLTLQRQSPIQEPPSKLSLYEKGERVRNELGGYQCDFSFCGDTGLKVNETRCPENCPDNHKTIIPEFKITDLEEGFQKQEIVDWILREADLTVLVKVSCVSTRRAVEKDYPFSEWAGAHFTRSGTGCIEDVHINMEHSNPQRCPCLECQHSDKPSYTWGVVSVSTATHVVFDDFEARNTTVSLFYDEESEKIRHKHIVTLRGLSIIRDGGGGMHEELSVLRCVTHKARLCAWVRQLINKTFMSYLKVTKLSLPEGRDLAVMISHPHGQKKRLTIGKVLETHWDGVKTLTSVDKHGGYVLHYEFTPDSENADADSPGLEVEFPNSGGQRVSLCRDQVIPTGTTFYFTRNTRILLPTNDEYTFTIDTHLTLREGHINLPSGVDIVYLNEDIFGLSELSAGVDRRDGDGNNIENSHHCLPKTKICTPTGNFTLKAEAKFINAYFLDPIEFRTANARPRFWSNAWNKLYYDTPSCPGSSGAKVLTIKHGFYGYPHSEKLAPNKKTCGIGRPW